MPPEYITKEEYEKLREEYGKLREEYGKLREEFNEKLFKLRKQIQEERAREEERAKVMEKMLSRLWAERMIYVSIIIAAVSIFVTIIVMM